MSHMPCLQSTNTSAELSFLTAPAPGSNDLLQIIVTADMGYCEVGEFDYVWQDLTARSPLIASLGYSTLGLLSPMSLTTAQACCMCCASRPAQSAAYRTTVSKLTQLPCPFLMLSSCHNAQPWCHRLQLGMGGELPQSNHHDAAWNSSGPEDPGGYPQHAWDCFERRVLCRT